MVSGLVGAQTPRVRYVPPYVASKGQVAIEIAAACGITLDEWQRNVLIDACGIREDGKWAAFEIGLALSRQNGKGGVLEPRELAGVVEFGEKLVIHSAHEFATSTIAMDRMEEALEESGLKSELKPRGGILRSHGSEGFVFKNGGRIWYRTRTAGGGRGFSGDLVVFDEAMILKLLFIGSLMPTVSAKSITGNPQLWYTGSAVDQLIHEHGAVFARLRARGLTGADPSLAWFEWSGAPAADANEQPITPGHPDVGPLLDNPAVWAEANPALGIRISAEHVANERRSMDSRTFAVERLGIGDWPDIDATDAVIDPEAWARLVDRDSQLGERFCFGIDISPGRTFGAIGAAGLRDDDKQHVEVVEHRPGTGWIVDRAVELARHKPIAFVIDGGSAAASLIPELEQHKLTVRTTTTAEFGAACGTFFDLVDQARLRHLDQPELNSAVKGTVKRPLGDAAFAWSRKHSGVDISSLVACTVAAWGAATIKRRKAVPAVMYA